jgi:hypothetical protein
VNKNNYIIKFIILFPKKIIWISFLNLISFSVIYINKPENIISFIFLYFSILIIQYSLLKVAKIQRYKFYIELFIFDLVILISFFITNIDPNLYLFFVLLSYNFLYFIFDFIWTHKEKI